MKTTLIKFTLFCTLLLTFILSHQAGVPIQAQSFSCSSVSQIPQAECTELVNLYNVTQGTHWTTQTGWLTTSTPCSWYGIICKDRHVDEINLGYNKLTGSIPDFANLPQLKKLNLYGNELSGEVPDFTDLPSLSELYLYSNSLTGPIPNFSHTPNLTDIRLHSNHFTGTVPNFSYLPNLVVLFLADNELRGTIPDFSNSPQLQFLDLSDNQLTGTIPDFSNLPQLTWLYLNYNQLSGTIPNFAHLPRLTQLWLHYNQLTGSLPTFSNLPLLNWLHLHYNQLSGVVPDINWSKFTFYLSLNNNCGLTPLNETQATLLSSKDPQWQRLYFACSIIPTPTDTPTPIPNPTKTPIPADQIKWIYLPTLIKSPPLKTPTPTLTPTPTPTPTITPTPTPTATPLPLTTLYIKSENNDGIVSVTILNVADNQLLLQCGPIGNNVSDFLCGQFKTVDNYKLVAVTNKCDTITKNFNDAKPGGTVQRRVGCY